MMKLDTIYKLIKLGFVPVKTNIVPLATEAVETLGYSNLFSDSNKNINLIVSDSFVEDGLCFVRLDKTCGKSNDKKFYHKIIETYLEENQVINYIEDKIGNNKINENKN